MKSVHIMTGLCVLLGIMGSTARASYLGVLDAANPLVHYSFSETTGLPAADANLDGIAAAYDATYVGNPTLGGAGPATSGFPVANTSVTLSGSGQYVTTPGTVGSELSNGFSIVMWLNTLVSNSTMTLFSGRYGTGTNIVLQLNRNAADNAVLADGIRLYVRDELNTSHQKGAAITTPSTDITDGNWHMIVASYLPDGLNHGIALYVDGAAAGITYQANANYDTSTNHVFHNFTYTGLGVAYNSSGVPSSLFTGSLDEVSIFSRVLSAGEVQSLYDARLVPEPASLAMLAMAGLCVLRRRS